MGFLRFQKYAKYGAIAKLSIHFGHRSFETANAGGTHVRTLPSAQTSWDKHVPILNQTTVTILIPLNSQTQLHTESYWLFLGSLFVLGDESQN